MTIRRTPDLRADASAGLLAPLPSSGGNFIRRFIDWLMPPRSVRPTPMELRHRALIAKRKWQQARLHHESSRELYEEFRNAKARQLWAELGR